MDKISIFDTSILKEISFHNQFGCDDVTVFGFLRDYWNRVSFDLYAYKGNLTKKPMDRSIAFIYTEIKNNSVYIIDVQSKIEDSGNGRKIFYDLLNCIILVNKVYPISKMYGFLSPEDFDHWDKLLYFYNSLDKYVTMQNDLPIKLDFKLREYIISDLVINMNKYCNDRIYFDIYITYL